MTLRVNDTKVNDSKAREDVRCTLMQYPWFGLGKISLQR